MPSPVQRRALVRRILGSGTASTQEALRVELRALGVEASQSTVSRDLRALGAERSRDADGRLVYSLPAAPGARDAEAADRLDELLLATEVLPGALVLRVEAAAEGWVAALLHRIGEPFREPAVTLGPGVVVVHSSRARELERALRR